MTSTPSLDAHHAANEGFVYLNHTATLAHRRQQPTDAHGFTQAVHQKPRRFVAYTQHAVDLMGANALLGCHHQEQRRQPFGERDFGALEYRVHGHRKLLAALRFVALVYARTVSLTLKLGDLVLIGVAAMRANPTVGPNAGFKPFAGCDFVVENWVFEKIGHRVAPMTETYR